MNEYLIQFSIENQQFSKNSLKINHQIHTFESSTKKLLFMKPSIIKTLLILITTFFLNSCGVEIFNGVTGNKNVITKNRTTTAEFSQIKISNGLDLEISQGAKNSIILEADENLHELIFTEIENGVLKIYAEKNIWKAASKKVLVTVKNLTELKAASGAFVENDETFKSDTLRIIAKSGAEINLVVKGNSITTVATSGADLKISGHTNFHNATATSGASIKAKSLESENASATATSGADIDIFASENITATATSGGDIDFVGNPKKINKKTTSGGSVSGN